MSSDNTNTQNPDVDAQAVAETSGEERLINAEIRRRNLAATFGSGFGKLALIAAGVSVVVMAALATNGMRKPRLLDEQAKVDAPQAPQPRVTNDPVTPEEAARRAEQARQEAMQAHEAGQSYQPGFDYNIGGGRANPTSGARFSGFETQEEMAARNQGNVPTLHTQHLASPSPSQQQAEQQRREQEVQRAAEKLAAEQKAAEAERDKHIEAVSQEILKQIGGMFSSQGGDSLNNLGGYSQTVYYSAPPAAAASQATAADRAMSALEQSRARTVLIKAGSTAYATLDSEANTDDGRTVLATVRSGPWKGSKLIGQIEQAYNNMSLTFTIMAPQDDRPTMRVRAVALREQDAKMGMAETIDHHTFSRYTALAAAALLQGAGRLYQQPVGTTVITDRGIVITTETPRDRQVIGAAVGELGMVVGSEIRNRGFNRPTTYATPAETGFILYFLEDVMPQSGEQQQQPVTLPPTAMPVSLPAMSQQPMDMTPAYEKPYSYPGSASYYNAPYPAYAYPYSGYGGYPRGRIN